MKVFFDTMVFLHYRNLDQVDLTQVLGPPPHTVLVPRITLRELDKHKNTHRSSRIQDRARKILKKIEAWTGGTNIRPGVSAEFLSAMPLVDYASLGLNPDWSDDILIAATFKYKSDHPEESIVLVTQDSGPRMTAAQLGIDVRELPSEWKLPVEPDPIEVENRELAKTIAALQKALPKLIVAFEGTEDREQHATFTLPRPLDSMEHEIIRKLDELRIKLPKQYPPQPVPTELISVVSLLQSQLTNLGIPTDEYERYNRGVDEYVRNYEGYIRATWETKAAPRRSIRFKVEIRNVGTAPAEDVDVLLHFPDGFRLFTKYDDFLSLPKEPRPPQKPRTKVQIMAESFNYIPQLDFLSPALPNFSIPSSFSIKRTGSYDVRDHFARIKHGDRVLLPEMFLIFDSYESAGSFNCQYSVRPANLPEAIAGELHFVIEKEDANTNMDNNAK
jgi:ubiquitin-protein ligase